ncbi:MAG: response regulator [Flavisolibacter sp.]|jgi:CheY-like chemotaxis protein
MSRKGPIIIIEDDLDDQDILREVFQELKIMNPLKFFLTCAGGLDYLITTKDQPFLIISDVNLPVMSGLEMRKKINDNERLRKKSIPFIFLSTSATQQSIEMAYEMMVQGYFEKPTSMKELKSTIQMIVQYWQVCRHPNSNN